MLTLSETKDYKAIAALNEDAQNLHAKLHPDMFKPFNKPDMEKAMETYFTDPNYSAYIVKQGELNIGYAVFLMRELKENAFHYNLKVLYIDQISVLAGYRRTGAGKILMEQAERTAKENSIHKIELDHWSSNKIAAAFFRNNGYKLYKERLFKIIS